MSVFSLICLTPLYRLSYLANAAYSSVSFPHVAAPLHHILISSLLYFGSSHHFVCMSTSPSSKRPPPVDVWSVGCIVAEMIRGSVLFPGTDRILPHHWLVTVCVTLLGAFQHHPVSVCVSCAVFCQLVHLNNRIYVFVLLHPSIVQNQTAEVQRECTIVM